MPSLLPFDRDGKSVEAVAPRSSGDPRIIAFVELVDAIDGCQRQAMTAATRRLRSLGLSVYMCNIARPGGGA